MAEPAREPKPSKSSPAPQSSTEQSSTEQSSTGQERPTLAPAPLFKNTLVLAPPSKDGYKLTKDGIGSRIFKGLIGAAAKKEAGTEFFQDLRSLKLPIYLVHQESEGGRLISEPDRVLAIHCKVLGEGEGKEIFVTKALGAKQVDGKNQELLSLRKKSLSPVKVSLKESKEGIIEIFSDKGDHLPLNVRRYIVSSTATRDGSLADILITRMEELGLRSVAWQFSEESDVKVAFCSLSNPGKDVTEIPIRSIHIEKKQDYFPATETHPFDLTVQDWQLHLRNTLGKDGKPINPPTS